MCSYNLTNCWVDLQILGQPCEFYLSGRLGRHGDSRAVRVGDRRGGAVRARRCRRGRGRGVDNWRHRTTFVHPFDSFWVLHHLNGPLLDLSRYLWGHAILSLRAGRALANHGAGLQDRNWCDGGGLELALVLLQKNHTGLARIVGPSLHVLVGL